MPYADVPLDLGNRGCPGVRPLSLESRQVHKQLFCVRLRTSDVAIMNITSRERCVLSRTASSVLIAHKHLHMQTRCPWTKPWTKPWTRLQIPTCIRTILNNDQHLQNPLRFELKTKFLKEAERYESQTKQRRVHRKRKVRTRARTLRRPQATA